ncbi:MAG: twin-arginine translocase TatA/TatE family subunit [Flavobacteriales bacterium]
MSSGEILMILVVYLLLFGAKGMPALAQTLGKAVYQFRNATKDMKEEIMKGADEIKQQANLRMDQLDIQNPLDDSPSAAQPTQPFDATKGDQPSA